jgi:hypothetical protein
VPGASYSSLDVWELASYVAAPHSARPFCPHCDADLFAIVVRPAAPQLSATTSRRPAS